MTYDYMILKYYYDDMMIDQLCIVEVEPKYVLHTVLVLYTAILYYVRTHDQPGYAAPGPQ